MEHYLIIADDFTGANDTGVQLRRRGIPVRVVFSSSLISGEDSCVLDTESRGINSAAAFEQVSAQCETIPFERFAQVIKKVDSTLRGNIGGEIRAIDMHFKAELIIVAPALPDLGRTTLKGVHHLNGVPVSKTELARDPKTPVREDHIQRLMSGSFDEKITHIEIEAVRRGYIRLEEGRIFTFDVLTNEDMQTIIQSALTANKRILWVGSAAMADNLLSLKYTLPPALGVIASLSAVTRDQVLYAEKQGVQLVKAPLYALLDKQISPEDIAGEAVGLLKECRDCILISSSTYSRDEYLKAEKAAAWLGLTSEEMSTYTQRLMGQLTGLILKEIQVSGLFLAGGDTAVSFFDCVGSLGSSIITEIAVGIPLMRLQGGVFDGMKVITKAGAFGKEDAIFYGLRKLREADS